MKYINKKTLFGMLTMSTISLSHAQTLTVEITEIDFNRQGEIIVMLFTKEGFPKKHQLAKKTQQASALTSSLTFNFDGISYPEFAIKVLHDEDLTGEVSKNWTGIFPSEGLGFSNGASLSFGPPSFRQAKLSLNGIDGSVVIPVVYP